MADLRARLPLPDDKADQVVTIGPVWPAQFEGTCAVSEKEFSAGTLITYNTRASGNTPATYRLPTSEEIKRFDQPSRQRSKSKRASGSSKSRPADQTQPVLPTEDSEQPTVEHPSAVGPARDPWFDDEAAYSTRPAADDERSTAQAPTTPAHETVTGADPEAPEPIQVRSNPLLLTADPELLERVPNLGEVRDQTKSDLVGYLRIPTIQGVTFYVMEMDQDHRMAWGVVTTKDGLRWTEFDLEELQSHTVSRPIPPTPSLPDPELDSTLPLFAEPESHSQRPRTTPAQPQYLESEWFTKEDRVTEDDYRLAARQVMDHLRKENIVLNEGVMANDIRNTAIALRDQREAAEATTTRVRPPVAEPLAPEVDSPGSYQAPVADRDSIWLPGKLDDIAYIETNPDVREQASTIIAADATTETARQELDLKTPRRSLGVARSIEEAKAREEGRGFETITDDQVRSTAYALEAQLAQQGLDQHERSQQSVLARMREKFQSARDRMTEDPEFVIECQKAGVEPAKMRQAETIADAVAQSQGHDRASWEEVVAMAQSLDSYGAKRMDEYREMYAQRQVEALERVMDGRQSRERGPVLSRS